MNNSFHHVNIIAVIIVILVTTFITSEVPRNINVSGFIHHPTVTFHINSKVSFHYHQHRQPPNAVSSSFSDNPDDDTPSSKLDKNSLSVTTKIPTKTIFTVEASPLSKKEKMNQATKSNSIINILHLLSASIDACARGCQVIRHVHYHRRRTKPFQGGDDEYYDDRNQNLLLDGGVRYKVENDPRSALTEADGASQKVIVECLRSVWGKDLHIIGEEEEENREDGHHGGDDEGDDTGGGKRFSSADSSATPSETVFAKYGVDDPVSARPLSCTLLENISNNHNDHYVGKNGKSINGTISSNAMLNLSDITVFIDPLDGTREFVEQRLNNVQCLVGIVYRGQPVGGVIGIPFPAGINDHNTNDKTCEPIEIVYGAHMEDFAFLESFYFLEDSSFISNEKMGANFRPPLRKELGATKSATGTISATSDSTGTDTNVNVDGITRSEEDSFKCSESSLQSKVSLHVFTNDSNQMYLRRALKCLQEWTTTAKIVGKIQSSLTDNQINLNVKVAGGCGNKFLLTTKTILDSMNNKVGIENGNALSVMPPSTCLWDTAAPTAILLSALAKYHQKGKVTDLFGADLVYDPKSNEYRPFSSTGELLSSSERFKNDLGVLVSCGDVALKYHKKLCEVMKADAKILNSLLGKYWDNTSNTISTGEFNSNMNRREQEDNGRIIDYTNEDNVISLENFRELRLQPQAADVIRDERGHLFTCIEIQNRLLSLLDSKNDVDSDRVNTIERNFPYCIVGYAFPESDVVHSSNYDKYGNEIFVVESYLYLAWKKVKLNPHLNDQELPKIIRYKKTIGIEVHVAIHLIQGK